VSMWAAYITNVYHIFVCTAADLLKPGLSLMMQLKTYSDEKSNCSGLDKVILIIAPPCGNNVSKKDNSGPQVPNLLSRDPNLVTRDTDF